MLMELLDSIVLATKNIDSKWVDICISDNASTDETCELVNAWSAQNVIDIKYACAPLNRGADWNFLNAADMANGEYIWLMGSDDKVSPNAIRTVLESMDARTDICVLGRKNMDFSMSACMSEEAFVAKDGIYDMADKKQMYAYLDACRGVGGFFSYLSSIVVRKQAWNSHLDGVEKFMGTAYSHAYVLSKIAFNGGVIQAISAPLVLNRGGNDSFQDKGSANRVLIDLEGYASIFDSMEHLKNDPVCREKFFRLISRERPLLHSLFYLRKHGNAAEWGRAKNVLNTLGVSSWLVRVVDLCGGVVHGLHIGPVRYLARKILRRR